MYFTPDNKEAKHEKKTTGVNGAAAEYRTGGRGRTLEEVNKIRYTTRCVFKHAVGESWSGGESLGWELKGMASVSLAEAPCNFSSSCSGFVLWFLVCVHGLVLPHLL